MNTIASVFSRRRLRFHHISVTLALMTDEKLYDNLNIEKKENSQVEVTAEIPAEKLAEYRQKALMKLGKDVEIDGFRKGNVPQDVLEKKLGEDAILQETAQMAISDAYPQIVLNEGVAIIGQPQISITKLAAGNPLGFTITGAVFPEFELPEYKKLADEELRKESESTEVTDEELTEALKNVKQHQKQFDDAQKKEKEKESGIETPSEGLLGPDGQPIQTEEEATQSDGQKEEQETPTSEAGSSEEELPELRDDFVKMIGEYRDVAHFTDEFKKMLKQDKERRANEKKRSQIAERLISETNIDVPEVLVEAEIDKMFGQFRGDVERAGLSFDQYLEQINKTQDDLRKEWRTDAEKRAKLELILHQIAQKENIKPSQEEVEREIEHLVQQHPDQNIDKNRAYGYIEHLLTNEKVFQFLEGKANASDAKPETGNENQEEEEEK